MKIAKIVIFTLTGLIALIISLNFGDAKIKPEYKDILDRKITVPRTAVDGFKYFLGLRTSNPDQDPYNMGTLIYQSAIKETSEPNATLFKPQTREALPLPAEADQFADGKFIGKERYSTNKKVYDMVFVQTTIQRDRLDKMLGYQAYALDQKPTFSFLAAPMNYYFQLMRIKIAYLTAQLHKGKSAEFVDGLRNMNRFLVNSLSYPDTMLGSIINTVLLKQLHEVYDAAKIEYPNLKKISWVAPPSYDDVLKNVLYVEGNFVKNVFNSPLKFEDFELSSINDKGETEKSWLQSASPFISWALPLFFKPGKSLNLYMEQTLANANNPCVKNASVCEPVKVPVSFAEKYISNPIGVRMTDIFTLNVERFKRLYTDLELLKAPQKK